MHRGTPLTLQVRPWIMALPLLAGPLFVQGQTGGSGNPLDTLPALPAQTPAAATPAQLPAMQAAQQALLQRQITAQRFDILGVSTMEFEKVAAIFEPLAGKSVAVSQLIESAQQVTQLYQQAGYALSFAYVPPQDFAAGVVRIVVVEGHVAQIMMQGDPGRSQVLIEQVADPLLAQKPLRMDMFLEQTQRLARMPGVQVTASANPPTTTDGATALQLETRHRLVDFTLGGEFRQGQSRTIATVLLNDPLWAGSQWQLSSLLRDPSKERFLSIGWTQWLHPSGTLLRTSYSDYRIRDELTDSSIDDRKSQKRFDIGINHPIFLSAESSAQITVGFHATDYLQAYRFNPWNIYLDDEERIRALYLQWQWQRATPQTAQHLWFTVARGLDGLGSGMYRRTNSAANLGEHPAEAAFTRFAFDLGSRYRLPNRWGIAFGAGGQYSPDVLPTPERVSFGGTRYGRAYRGGEIAGDRGLGLSAEVNYQFNAENQRWFSSIEPYVLLEQAKTWQELPGLESQRLGSTAVGVRLGDGQRYALDLAIAKPRDATFYNPRRKVRLSLNLSYQFKD